MEYDDYWFARGPTPDGERRIALSGTKVLESHDESLGAPIVLVDDGPPDLLPAPVIPSGKGGVPGWVQDTPADLISGWVRLWVAGVLDLQPEWDGVVCAMHGDVTHWIDISANEAVSTRSAMTLRLCRVLQGGSEAQAEAVSASLSRPERLASDLRAAEVAGDKASITGHLIGAELASTRAYWLGRDVVILSDVPSLYGDALTNQGVPVVGFGPEEVLPRGLAALARVRGYAR